MITGSQMPQHLRILRKRNRVKIGIIGSRGIPNHYGGFEQFAQYLSVGLIENGFDVWVYNSSTHPYKEAKWEGVNLIHCNDPEDRTGTSGQFIYDLNCINDSRHRDFDVILQLGYTSSSVWHRRLPAGARIITNMDGLEWKRSKYSYLVRRFLKHAEKLAVRSSHALVADSEAIQQYLWETYQAPSTFIPYGADIYEDAQPNRLHEFGLVQQGYYLLIARMQPDNHIEVVINGVLGSGTKLPLVILGDTANNHGRYLEKNYRSQQIRFAGGVFDKELLNQLRRNCALYFHGHSAGGTNPSLLEAMAASSPICAHDNPFNKSVLGNDACYFRTSSDISALIDGTCNEFNWESMIRSNIHKIKVTFSWQKVIQAYIRLFNEVLE